MSELFTKSEEELLLRAYKNNVPINDIAESMKRTPRSIDSKLRRLRDAGKLERVTREANEKRTSSFKEDIDSAEVTMVTDERIKTLDDLIRVCEIDTETWDVDKWLCSKSEAYRKDKKVDWTVRDGVVVDGRVQDSGGLLVKPMYSVKAWLVRKTKEIRNRLVRQDIIDDLKTYSPKSPKITYPKLKDGMLYMPCIFDAHIGKLTWADESGENSDLKTQTARVEEVLFSLLSHTKNYPIERILLPIGNDFYNTDSKFNATTAGTPQNEDTRWQKTFRVGRMLAMQMVKICTTIAPVDVLIVSGNHDETRTFFLGDALEAIYSNDPNVTVNNSARRRKYYLYGKTLMGFTHGNEEKIAILPQLMAHEVPEMWSKANSKEWFTGDKHHQENMTYNALEAGGVVVRKLRSISPADAWHASKGFTMAKQGGEGFLIDKQDGVVGHFMTVAKAGETNG